MRSYCFQLLQHDRAWIKTYGDEHPGTLCHLLLVLSLKNSAPFIWINHDQVTAGTSAPETQQDRLIPTLYHFICEIGYYILDVNIYIICSINWGTPIFIIQLSNDWDIIPRNKPSSDFAGYPHDELENPHRCITEVAPWSGGSPGHWDFAGEFRGQPPRPKAGAETMAMGGPLIAGWFMRENPIYKWMKSKVIPFINGYL